jgi:hypothetical protein
MHYIFKTFNVGAGDCMTLLLQNGNDELHIMVDCGNFTKEVSDYVTHTFGKRIDYLCVFSHKGGFRAETISLGSDI